MSPIVWIKHLNANVTSEKYTNKGDSYCKLLFEDILNKLGKHVLGVIVEHFGDDILHLFTSW